MKIEFENTDNFERNFCQSSYEPYLRHMAMVVFRASLGHKDAIEALDELRRLQLKSLDPGHNALHELNQSVDPSGKFERTLFSFMATDIWEKAMKKNPPSGNDGYAVNHTNWDQFYRAYPFKKW